jgi:hypothetical protein
LLDEKIIYKIIRGGNMSKEKRLPEPEQKIIETAKTLFKVTAEKTELVNYGMGKQYLADFEADILSAAGFKTDKALTAELKTTTAAKDAKLAEAFIWGEDIKIRLELAYPNNKIIAGEFPPDFKKAKKDEALMIETIPEIATLIDKYAEKLKEKGLPDTHKQTGLDILKQLDELNTKQEKLKKDRPQYTRQRVDAYFKLYDRINKINEVGKKAYAKSPADVKAFVSPWPVSKKKVKEVSEEKK